MASGMDHGHVHPTMTMMTSFNMGSMLQLVAGADLGGGCRGCTPLDPEMTYGFLIQLVFCKKCDLLVLVMPFLSGAPLLKKILDPPLSR